MSAISREDLAPGDMFEMTCAGYRTKPRPVSYTVTGCVYRYCQK